jgi:hypothetical protein
MDELFVRVDSEHHRAYSVTLRASERWMVAPVLFADPADAKLYMDAAAAWWDMYFPSCCIGGVALEWSQVQAELLTTDSGVGTVHAMSGRRWQLADVVHNNARFRAWKACPLARSWGTYGYEAVKRSAQGRRDLEALSEFAFRDLSGTRASLRPCGDVWWINCITCLVLLPQSYPKGCCS